MLLSAWVVAVVFSLIPLCWKTDSRLTIHKVYLFVEIVVFIFFPYLLMFVAYCLIFAILHEHFKMVQEMMVSVSRKEQARRLIGSKGCQSLPHTDRYFCPLLAADHLHDIRNGAQA